MIAQLASARPAGMAPPGGNAIMTWLPVGRNGTAVVGVWGVARSVALTQEVRSKIYTAAGLAECRRAGAVGLQLLGSEFAVLPNHFLMLHR